DDDLDVSRALAVVFDFMRLANKALDEDALDTKTAGKIKLFFGKLDSVFCFIEKQKAVALGDEISALVEEREAARKNRDFKRSDEIRDMLRKKGIVLEDTQNGVTWKKA
ncbi:MAG: DALR domain-containing protein, partial [Candidatus Micrarchaeota archaeon]